MAQILVRNLDDAVVEMLKLRAKAGNRSLQAEVKTILEGAAKLDPASAKDKATKIRSKLEGRRFSDSTEMIREDRDR